MNAWDNFLNALLKKDLPSSNFEIDSEKKIINWRLDPESQWIEFNEKEFLKKYKKNLSFNKDGCYLIDEDYFEIFTEVKSRLYLEVYSRRIAKHFRRQSIQDEGKKVTYVFGKPSLTFLAHLIMNDEENGIPMRRSSLYFDDTDSVEFSDVISSLSLLRNSFKASSNPLTM